MKAARKRALLQRRLERETLNLLGEMASARGWTIGREEWQTGSPRLDELKRQAAEIIASEDKFAAVERWSESLASDGMR